MMTQEEKARRYDEVLEQAKSWYVDAQIDFKKSLEALLPELKESENERTRKEIISFLQLPHKQFVGERKQEKWIAWLEKQGKKNSVTTKEEEKVREQVVYAINKLNVPESEKNKLLAWLEKQGELVNSLTKGLDNAHERIDELIQKNNELCINLEKQGEKKPAWSEDDEKRLQSCINILKAKSLMGKVDTANTMWLKSLKQRIGG